MIFRKFMFVTVVFVVISGCKPENIGNSSEATSESQETPEMCKNSQILPGAIINRSQFNNDTADALTQLMISESYNVNRIFVKEVEGTSICFAEITVNGTVNGTSYNNTFDGMLYTP